MKYKTAKVGIVGLGREGRSVVEYFSSHYPGKTIHVFDECQSNHMALTTEGNTVGFFGPDYLSTLDECSHVFVSPGVSIYKNEIISAQEKGVEIISTSQLWYDHHKDDFCIFVTGTKGKSTISSLIFHVLNKLKKNVHLIGNIGVPAVSSIVNTQSNIWVVEVSSYQSATLNVEPDIAVLSNLYPEHLDWHKNLKNYFSDKLRGLKASKLKIVNHDFKELISKEVNGEVTYYGAETGFNYNDRCFFNKETRLGSLSVDCLKGDHNMQNICAMLSVIDSMGIDPSTAIELLKDFKSLEHRQEQVAKINNTIYVNDCLSTIPQSTLCAIDCYQHDRVTLIVGGFDRGLGDEWEKLAKGLSSKLFAVIGLPDTGFKVIKHLQEMGSTSKLYCADSLAEAVGIAKEITIDGGVVLLSPASPSHNQYKNYEEKAACFRALVCRSSSN